MGEKCSTVCRYSEMKKNIENRLMPTSSPTMFAPRSVRRRKIENGISGQRSRSSIATKASSSSAAPASFSSVAAEPQPTFPGTPGGVHDQRKPGGDSERARDVNRAPAVLDATLHQHSRREARG